MSMKRCRNSPSPGEPFPGPWAPGAGWDGTEGGLVTENELLQTVLLPEVQPEREELHPQLYFPQTRSSTSLYPQRLKGNLIDLQQCLHMTGLPRLPLRASCPDATERTRASHSPCPPQGCHLSPRTGRLAEMVSRPQRTADPQSAAGSSGTWCPVWCCPLEGG